METFPFGDEYNSKSLSKFVLGIQRISDADRLLHRDAVSSPSLCLRVQSVQQEDCSERYEKKKKNQ